MGTRDYHTNAQRTLTSTRVYFKQNFDADYTIRIPLFIRVAKDAVQNTYARVSHSSFF